MPKKIAVIATDRQGEALRMTLGLLLADDVPTLFLLGKLENSEQNLHNLETMQMMDVEVFSNSDNPGFTTISNSEIAKRLAEADIVAPY
ncbi:MAG: hypothetical protein OEY64_03485 [Nitrospinota bacterium]|nr:hypothetical protein [Nitrospinota bacterium]